MSESRGMENVRRSQESSKSMLRRSQQQHSTKESRAKLSIAEQISQDNDEFGASVLRGSMEAKNRDSQQNSNYF